MAHSSDSFSPKDKPFQEIAYRPDKGYDPLLDIYHNTRHASPRHAFIKDKKGWHLRSPWLSRFDWILDTHLQAEHVSSDALYLTKQRQTPRTVFVKTGLVDLFVRYVLPDINHRIVLYIGNGDLPLSACGADISQLSRHPLIHWIFAENRDIELDRISAMPLGMHPREMIRENSVLELQLIADNADINKKLNKVFGAWGDKKTLFGTQNDRESAKQFMQARTDVCDYFTPMPLHDYWRTMSRYRFMLSPWGNSYDTAKTFEALIVKTIPIIMAGPYAEAYKDLPVVVVDDLSEINASNLERWWQSLSGRFENMGFVTADYWWRRIEQALPDKKRAFLVLGPESHGNHLVTDLLVHAGCHGHSGKHVSWHEQWQKDENDDTQPWDKALPTDQDPIVWRRSVPHLKNWPDIKVMVCSLEARDYQVSAIVVTREPYAALQSQLKWRHISDSEIGRANIEKAYKHIFAQLEKTGIHFVLTSYEALVNYPEAQDLLLLQLNIEPPTSRLPIWDGNQRWYDKLDYDKKNHHPKFRQQSAAAASDFPESWFTCYHPDYQQRIALGKQRMQASTVVFCGLARDVQKELVTVAQRIESAAAMFQDYRVVIYENDSQDGTLDFLQHWQQKNPRLTVLHEVLQAPRWGSVQDLERMIHLAYCRNQYLDYVAQHYQNFDYLIVLDTDLPKGFSYEGLANTFGHDDWDVVGSNGLLVPPQGRPPPDPMFFDAWAFRLQGDTSAQSFTELNQLQFHRGEALLPVWSCFGGLAIYRMECVRSGANYGGDDCEHVIFHRQLREYGLTRQFLNPSQILLYAGKEENG